MSDMFLIRMEKISLRQITSKDIQLLSTTVCARNTDTADETDTVRYSIRSKRAAEGPQIHICLGEWVVFDRPTRKKRLFFFSPPEGIWHFHNTQQEISIEKVDVAGRID